MTAKKNPNLKAVDTNIEEMNQQIRSHRKSVALRIVCVICVLLILAAGIGLFLSIRTFSSYTVLSETAREDNEAVEFLSFGNYILQYSNDGIALMETDETQIWNQSYEMTDPRVVTADDYAAVYDRESIGIYVVSQTKVVCHLEMTSPILSVSVSNQGTIAVLMKEDEDTRVKLYDKSGEELASGEFYKENGGFPVDIALSYDGKKMAVDMVDVSDGNLKSTITFYNFGSVGQNEINNNVGTYTYSDMFIPEIEYVSDDRMVALGNNEVVIFEGSEKPSVSAEIFPEEDADSIVYDRRHIAVISSAIGSESARNIRLYDMKGRQTMDVDTDLIYQDVYFLASGELCLTNENECQIFTAHRVKKFAYTFTDHAISRILSQTSTTQYVFVFEDSFQEVHLK